MFKPALDAAGLRHLRFHDLCHTCISLLIAQGESVKYIQRQLRHASSQIPWTTTGICGPMQNRESARRLDETLFGPTPQPLMQIWSGAPEPEGWTYPELCWPRWWRGSR